MNATAARGSKIGNRKSKSRHSRNRGGVYIIVLGAAMMVTIVGISALLAVRVQRAAARSAADALQARLLAESIIDVARFRINADADWRNTYAHNTWTGWETAGNATCRFKLLDERDGDLADEPADPARLIAEARVGDAVRLCGVELRAGDKNLLVNPGFENGTTGWEGVDSFLSTTTDQPHAGSHAVHVAGRTNRDAGPKQDVSGVLENNTDYTLTAWVRLASGTTQVGFTTYVVSGAPDGSSLSASGSPSNSTTVGQEWTKITRDFNTSWSGGKVLIEASIKISTNGGTDDMDVDSVSLVRRDRPPPMIVVPGSWRREAR